ncbi:MAG: hypothetical protein CMN72_14055 [Sphingomonas sp.]|nr:hypothetical protein [Sphingomonas sp.]
MNMGSVIGAGVRVAREQPRAVAIWTAIYIALLLPFGLLILPSLQATMAGDVAGLDPMAAIGHMGGLLLYYIVLTAMLLVLNNAAYRAILRPRDSRYAYLRVGMDELRILGLGMAAFLVFFLIVLLLSIAFGLGGGIGLFGSGTAPSGRGAAWAIVIGVGLYILAVFVSVRLALAFPLTVLRRRIVIGEAWRRSRGNFWALFGAFLVIFLIYSLVSALLTLITGGGTMATLFSIESMDGSRDMAAISPALLVPQLIASGISGMLWVLLSGCGLAMAARQLSGEDDEELSRIWA